MAPAAGILSVQVFSSELRGDSFTLAEAIVAAVDAGANVINLSLGSRGDSFLVRDAVEYALANNVALVAAAGNDAVDGLVYPARYDGVISVGCVDAGGRHVYFSNRGEELDIVAPGLGIAAAGLNDGMVSLSGSSAAAPLVSGALAAVLSQNPGMTAGAAADVLLQYADDAGAPGDDAEYGSGILNMARVQNRDVAGIYDVAAGTPYVLSEPGTGLSVALYVQNRGTENLPSVDLNIDIDGVQSLAAFYNLAPGETASRVFGLSESRLRESGSIRIDCSADIPGFEDAVASNNRRFGVVTTGSAPDRKPVADP
jgi:subtilisin family serine protease